MTHTQTTNAIAYIRVSTEEQAQEGVSLAAQEERILAYCQMAGLTACAILREEGVSAKVPLMQRPAGGQLSDLMERHQAAHVVALKLDRLFRDTIDALENARDWDAKGVALHIVDLGGNTLNTRSAMGGFFFAMLAASAEMERKLIGERTTQAMQHKKQNRQVYSPTPYGYDRQGDALVPNTYEQHIIESMRTLHMQDHCSYSKIADYLNDNHISTKQGGRWHASTVRNILQNTLHA